MNVEKFSAAAAALVLGGIFLIAALQLNTAPGYSDFIVGSVAWYAGDKLQDLISWPAFILASFFSYAALSKITSSLQESYGAGVSSSFATQLVLWSLPFYAGVGTLFLGGALDKKTVIISALGIISIGATGFFRRKNKEKPDPGFWGAILFLTLLISLIPLEVAVLLSRMPMDKVGDLSVGSFVKTNNVLIVIGFILGTLALIRINKKSHRHLSKAALAAQIGLPLLFLTLYPSRIMQPSGELAKYETTVYLKIFIVALIIYGMYDVVRRFRTNSGDADWKDYFSPLALFGLLVAIKIGHTVPPHISVDDYHFGEQLLGWWSYLNGFVPYVDYMPAHGLIENDLRPFLAYAFYDGTAASIGEAGRLALALLGLFAFISIYHFTRSLVLAFAVILLLGDRLTWFFFVPFLCLWLSPNLRSRPAKWLSVWILTAPIVVLGVPPQGLLLAAAFGFLAVKMTWDQIRIGDKKSWQYLGLIAALVLVIFAATPLLFMLLGAIRYVLENGPINQITYGIPWSLSWNAGAKFGFAFEAIRMSWVAIPILCLYVMQKHWRDIKDPRSYFYPGLIFFAFSLLLIPYSMGRIDPGSASRPGLVSIFSWAVLFPLLIWGLSKVNARAFVVLSVVFMSSILGYSVNTLSGLSSIATQKVNSAPLRDSIKAGLSNIGHAYVDENQWDRINRLNALLKSRLAADETYLDLSSRNAHYFYLNRLPAMPVTAPYNLVPPNQQKRAISALTISPPKLALLQADNITYDGGGLALRNPYLYRFVVNNYVPRMESGFIVGYLKPGAGGFVGTKITAEIKNITDENWLRGIGRRDAAVVLSDPTLVSMLKIGDRLRFANGESRVIDRIWVEESSVWLNGSQISLPDASIPSLVEVVVSPDVYQEYSATLFQRSFAVSDFQKIPVSWGRSEKSLIAKMTSTRSLDRISPAIAHVSSFEDTYKVEGNDPQLSFDISAFGLSGRSTGLLKFDFDCIDMKSEPRMQLFWWGDAREGPFEASSVRFTVENGTLIVPLDASPWWLSLRKVKGLRFDLDNAEACSAFSIKNIALFQRNLQLN